MQSHWVTTQCTALRRRELETEAANYRLARAGRKTSHRVVRIYAPAMARVGVWLIHWGERLQTHYSDVSTPVTPRRIAP